MQEREPARALFGFSTLGSRLLLPAAEEWLDPTIVSKSFTCAR